MMAPKEKKPAQRRQQSQQQREQKSNSDECADQYGYGQDFEYNWAKDNMLIDTQMSSQTVVSNVIITPIAEVKIDASKNTNVNDKDNANDNDSENELIIPQVSHNKTSVDRKHGLHQQQARRVMIPQDFDPKYGEYEAEKELPPPPPPAAKKPSASNKSKSVNKNTMKKSSLVSL